MAEPPLPDSPKTVDNMNYFAKMAAQYKNIQAQIVLIVA